MKHLVFSSILIAILVIGANAGFTQTKDQLTNTSQGAAEAQAIASAAKPTTRLDILFDALSNASNKQEAEAVERMIEQAWLKTGSAELDQLMTRGIIFMNHRKFDQAIQAFNAVIARMPDNAEAWNQRAAAYYVKGNLDQSWRDVKVAIDLNPRHFRALIGAGLIQQEFGDDAKALVSFEAALALHPHLGGVRDRVEALRSIVHGLPI